MASPVERHVLAPEVDGGLGVSSDILQRAVDLTQTTASENSNYYVANGNTKKLYSLTIAEPPRPKGLYHKKSDRSTLGTALFAWEPNVRLFSKAEKSVISEADEERGASKPELVRSLMDRAENPVLTNRTLELPSKGTVGDNDCAGWATTLRAMISSEGVDNTSQRKDSAMQVGDQMTHYFTEEALCPYHSATVVAKDGASLVALEAHAGQDITQPDFHIRNGVRGFMTDNDPTGKYTKRFQIDRAGPKSLDTLETSKVFYERAKADPTQTAAAPLNPYSMVTEMSPLHVARAHVLALVRAIANKYWGKHTSWKFVPTGVAALRTALRTVGRTPKRRKIQLESVVASAKDSAARPDPKKRRSEKTKDFYALVSGLDSDSLGDLTQKIVRLTDFRDNF